MKVPVSKQSKWLNGFFSILQNTINQNRGNAIRSNYEFRKAARFREVPII
jgi:hypothetical protein